MKAVVLSGGQGTRLRPITHSVPKQLVPVGGRSVLAHVLHDILDAGVNEVAIVVSPESKGPVEALLTSFDDDRLSASVVVQPQPNGLAAALGVALPVLGIGPVLLYLGDCLITGGIGHVVDQHRASGANATIMVTEVDDPSRYGIVELGGDGSVTRLVEKPEAPVSDLAIVGVYVFDEGVGAAIDRVTPSWRGEYEITDAIQVLVDDGGLVLPARLRGWWMDTGTIGDVLTATSRLLTDLEDDRSGSIEDSVVTGPVKVAEGACVRRSRLVGPLVIGPDSVVVDSVIGPDTTVGASATIEGATLEGSVVMDHVVVVGSRLVSSFLGPRAMVRGTGQSPLSVVVGADAVVSLDTASQSG